MSVIKTDRTTQTLSAFGGLVALQRAVALSQLEGDVVEALPQGQRTARKASPFDKFMAFFTTACCGAECIDDVEVMQNDPGIASFLSGKMVSAQAYGDFLRDFSSENIRKLNLSLRDHSRKLSAAAYPDQKEIVVSLDSTSHVQHGVQMEGVEYNYKNELALDSLQAYDQFGFPLYFDLRPGSTHTAKNAPAAIHHCFHGLHRKVKKMLSLLTPGMPTRTSTMRAMRREQSSSSPPTELRSTQMHTKLQTGKLQRKSAPTTIGTSKWEAFFIRQGITTSP